MNRTLYLAALLLGGAAVAWIGAGYVTSNPLALTMTVLIGAFYVMGALELQRFHQASASLGEALAGVPENLGSLGEWLAGLHPSLQNGVRLRVEGERVSLPGPSMTPYLVGLLVLLGMLGTFLGMVVTLKGAVLALESTTDLQAVRAALAAPVKGLGLAFGTSVAGVAASAMLGLMSALCRSERLQVAQALDSRIATVLRPFSGAHRREESFKALQAQAQAMPEVVERLHALMAQMERRSQALDERLLAGQDHFHRNAEAAYAALATSVDQSLRHSLSESARLAGATIQPLVEATMNGITRETAGLHAKVADAVQAHLQGVSRHVGHTLTGVADGWTAALAHHERRSDEAAQAGQRSLENFGASFERRAASLLATVEQAHVAWQADFATTTAGSAREMQWLHQRGADTLTSQLEGVCERLEQRSVSLLGSVQQAHGQWRAEAASNEQRRLAAWNESLVATAASLQQAWQQAGAQSLSRQELVCRTLEQTAREVTTQAEAHARSTLGEIGQLMQSAAEAPRLAAEVMAELRQRLSDSLARDNGLLEERSRIMATLGTLLDAVNHACTEQRDSIASLVASSSGLLERAGSRFDDRMAAESAKVSAAATQIAGSAVEVASLGEAFGTAVGQFGEANQNLIAQLQRIEAALGKSTARSDEQLAYYVAQAREIIDLSIMSQKQIVDDLQHLSLRQPRVAGEVG